MKTITAIIGVSALLFQMGCGSNQVVTSLQLVIAAAEAAMTTLEATGQIDPATATKITNYLTAVSTATSYAATELQSSDTPAQKATKIVQEFASVTAPVLPPGTAQTIISVVQAVTQAVANFLASIQPASAVSGSPALTLSSADRSKLQSIHARSEALKTRIAARR